MKPIWNARMINCFAWGFRQRQDHAMVIAQKAIKSPRFALRVESVLFQKCPCRLDIADSQIQR